MDYMLKLDENKFCPKNLPQKNVTIYYVLHLVASFKVSIIKAFMRIFIINNSFKKLKE